MGFMTIDGRKVEFTDEKNVLSVIRNAGINLPTLCYRSVHLRCLSLVYRGGRQRKDLRILF